MVQDAEANAEVDKKAREVVDAKNMADSQLHDARKDLKEYGDKITEDQKSKIEQAITEVEEAIKTNDTEKIKESVTKLFEPLSALLQAKQAAETPPTEPSDTTNSEKVVDDAIDTEFTEGVKND